jgi:hypothetical protein
VESRRFSRSPSVDIGYLLRKRGRGARAAGMEVPGDVLGAQPAPFMSSHAADPAFAVKSAFL